MRIAASPLLIKIHVLHPLHGISLRATIIEMGQFLVFSSWGYPILAMDGRGR